MPSMAGGSQKRRPLTTGSGIPTLTYGEITSLLNSIKTLSSFTLEVPSGIIDWIRGNQSFVDYNNLIRYLYANKIVFVVDDISGLSIDPYLYPRQQGETGVLSYITSVYSNDVGDEIYGADYTLLNEEERTAYKFKYFTNREKGFAKAIR